MTSNDRPASSPSPPSQQREWRLASTPASARTARAAVRGFLTGAGSSARDVDATMLVVSELISNAVVHSRAGGDIGLQVALSAGTVHVEVRDSDPAPPRPRTVTTDSPGGRGLHIVDEMTERWGWTALAGDGKQVWCDIGSPAVGDR